VAPLPAFQGAELPRGGRRPCVVGRRLRLAVHPRSRRLPRAAYPSPPRFFLECCRAQNLAFPAPQSPPWVGGCLKALWVPFRVLKSSACLQCTPKLSFCLSLHPGALLESSSTPKTSKSLSVGPELSLDFSESHRLRSWAPQDPPRDIPHALQPSTCLSLCPRPLCPAFGVSPGDAARWESRAVGRAARANVLRGEQGSHRAAARPTWEGSPLPVCVQGQEWKRRFGDLSSMRNPDEKEPCKAEGKEQRRGASAAVLPQTSLRKRPAVTWGTVKHGSPTAQPRPGCHKPGRPAPRPWQRAVLS